MRTTVTYILRLLVDDDEPGSLRGILKSIAGNEELSFTDAASLMDLLRLKQEDLADIPRNSGKTDSI